MRADDDLLLDDPLDPSAPGWFDLSGPVGRGFDTRREDAIRLEAILANSGDHDLGTTDGPTGYWGTALDGALRRYQKRHGLKADGWLGPEGPTIAHMRDAFGGMFDGYDVPTPDDVDAHHAALDAGDAPHLAIRRKTELAKLRGLPDIGEAGRGSNASQIDWLLRNRTGLDGVPAQFARYVTGLGGEGIAQARDFVGQYAHRDPQGTDALVDGILRELPDDASRTLFLGRTPGGGQPPGTRLPDAPPPVRTMEMRPDRDGAPQPRDFLHRNGDPEKIQLMAAADSDAPAPPDDSGADPQTAEVQPDKRDPLGPDKAAIAPDIDAFMKDALGKDYVGTNSECVALVKEALPELGATPNWRAGDAIKGMNDPPLQPGTAVATFVPDASKNGEPRYLSKPTGNHAGLFMGYGEENGKPGMYLLDQSRERHPQQSFFPFERSPGDRRYVAGQFSVIQPSTRK